MVVLQGRLIIVCQGNGVSSLDEEVVVEAAMLKVMDDGRPVGGEVEGAQEGICLQQAAMAQQHVCHLKHTGHVCTAHPLMSVCMRCLTQTTNAAFITIRTSKDAYIRTKVHGIEMQQK